MLKIDLADEGLFGNEAAEDERQEVFEAYAYMRKEVEPFSDTTRPVQVVRAYKGEGKSALMRIARTRIETASSDSLVTIDTVGPNVSPDLESTDFSKWVREWKANILAVVAGEIGSRIGFAWTDDGTSLVELAEAKGFKSRNFVSMIVDRLRSRAIPVERERQPPADIARTLTRWAAKMPEVWLFIDDIDRNFDGTKRDELRIAAFFDACRSIAKDIQSIRFRLAIRPNTWATVKRAYEGMSHVEQYSFNLKWVEAEMLALLGRRIEGYLRRTNQIELVGRRLPVDLDERYRFLTTLVFETPIQWGDGKRPIHVPLDSLSLHRPRWMIELCRVSGKAASARGASKIGPDDIFGQLDAFGRRRIDDLIAEFTVQCPDIAEILDGFRGQAEQYLTADLLTLIENRISNHVAVRLPGRALRASHREIASFLFEIGFIFARRDFDDKKYEHLGFADQPSLLVSRTDTDSGYSWEIPSTYRQALDLRTSEGFERPIVPRAKKPARRFVT